MIIIITKIELFYTRFNSGIFRNQMDKEIPFYEQSGPTSDYVRSDQFQYFMDTYWNFIESQNLNITQDTLKHIVYDVLLKYIPNSMKNFGSFKGYAVFGLEKKLKLCIDQEIEKRLHFHITSNVGSYKI